MMYKALKPCTISGKKYLIDDEVDVSLLTEKDIASLEKKKFVVEAGLNAPVSTDDAEPIEKTVEVPVITEDGTITVDLTAEQLCKVVTVIQSKAEEAVEEVNLIEDEDSLILIHRLDSRKTVQKAAKEKAEALIKAKADAEVEAKAKADAEAKAGEE